MTVECGITSPPLASVTDTCDASPLASEVDGSEDLSGMTSCNGNIGTYTRDFEAVDHCGNTAGPTTQTVTVQDTTSPVLPSPILPVVVELVDDTVCSAVSNVAEPSATDACTPSADISITSCDASVTPIAGGSLISRQWTATDCSGNTDTKTQDIYVMEKCEFNIDQAFSGQPMDMVFSIKNIYEAGVIPPVVTGVTVDVSIAEGFQYTGDIRGVFFNLASETITSTFGTGFPGNITVKVGIDDVLGAYR